MEKGLNEELVRMEKEIKELPKKAQWAIYWIVENFDFVIEVCKESNMIILCLLFYVLQKRIKMETLKDLIIKALENNRVKL